MLVVTVFYFRVYADDRIASVTVVIVTWARLDRKLWEYVCISVKMLSPYLFSSSI